MEKENEIKQFMFEVPMQLCKELTPNNVENYSELKASNNGARHAVAIIGDRFYKGAFLPAKELKKVYKLWEGTLHDINHFGTTFPVGFFAISNILYFVGYNNNVKWNNKNKSVSMDINIRDDTKYAGDWRAYVALCEEAGNVPNVSIAFNAKTMLVKASELPKGVNWKEQGYKKDDLVEYIYDIQPQALSTVLKGACNDKNGCGIGIQNNEDNEQEEKDAQKEAIIKWLKENE